MRSLLLLALVGACASTPAPTAPAPEPVGPEAMVEPDVPVVQYQIAGIVLEALGRMTEASGREHAGCITRWNTRWSGDSLRSIELIAAVPLPAQYADDNMFVPQPAVGNCWWQLPSVHWHTLHAEPSVEDYAFAVRSAAPFHLVIYQGQIRVYAARLGALRRSNTR